MQCPGCNSQMTEKNGYYVCEYCGYKQKKPQNERPMMSSNSYPIMVYREKKKAGYKYTAYDIQYEWECSADDKETAINKLKAMLEKETNPFAGKPSPKDYSDFISDLAASEVPAKIEWIELDNPELDW